MIERTVRCLCGATSIAARGAPAIVNACCCHDCQLRSGSAFAYSAFFPAAAVTVAGNFASYTHRFDSGRRETAHRCSTCGTAMWFVMDAIPDHIGVPAGIFQDSAFPAPQTLYFVSRRHDWLPLPAGIPTEDTL